MIRIDEKKCIGCGQCAYDCNAYLITMENGIAKCANTGCNLCAHCIAVCPVNAVTIDEYDCTECVEKEDLKLELDPQAMLDSMKFRRSIRHFLKKPIEKEKLDRIFEAGRYAPTASNGQDVRYFIVKDRMKVTDMVLDGMIKLADEMEARYDSLNEVEKRYMVTFRNLRKTFDESGKTADLIFHGCDTLIGIVAYSDIDAGIAAQAMMMQAVSEGIGVLYNGFFRRGIDFNPELRAYLGLKPGEQMFTSLCLGYSDHDYVRTAPRYPLNLTIIE